MYPTNILSQYQSIICNAAMSGFKVKYVYMLQHPYLAPPTCHANLLHLDYPL